MSDDGWDAGIVGDDGYARLGAVQADGVHLSSGAQTMRRDQLAAWPAKAGVACP